MSHYAIQPDNAQCAINNDNIVTSKYIILEKHPNNGYTQCNVLK